MKRNLAVLRTAFSTPDDPLPLDMECFEAAQVILSAHDDFRHSSYLTLHLHRLAMTAALIPMAGNPRARCLELGSYLHLPEILLRVHQYSEVVCTGFAAMPIQEKRSILVDGTPREIRLDLLDLERHRLPYEDGSFETAISGEVLEHLLVDPMHMLLELRRVLKPGGTLVLTTPNISSWGSLSNILHAQVNPQIYSRYPQPSASDDRPHIREYTPKELNLLLTEAGFTVTLLTTSPIQHYPRSRSVRLLAAFSGAPLELRGEQTFAVAVTNPDAIVRRYPEFLYDT